MTKDMVLASNASSSIRSNCPSKQNPENRLAETLNLFAGLLARQGKRAEAEQLYCEALPLFRKNADRGYALATNTVGTFYARGVCVATNPVEAVRWHRMAAEQGEAYGQGNLG